MGENFSASEIVQIGINIEENGRDFYTAAAKSSRSNKLKEAFLFLAQEEESHIKVFQGILSRIEDYQPQEAYPEEYFSYLTALSEGHIFTEGKKGNDAARKINSDRDAVEFGISIEEESILFYHEMKNVVSEKAQSIIDQLINEERSHLFKLIDIKHTLTSPSIIGN